MFTAVHIQFLQGNRKTLSSPSLKNLIRKFKELLQDSPGHDLQEYVEYFDALGPVSEMDDRAKKELVDSALEVMSQLRPFVYAAIVAVPPGPPSAAPLPAKHAVLPAPRSHSRGAITNYGISSNAVTVRLDGVLNVHKFTAQMSQEWPDEPEKNITIGRIDEPVRSVDRVEDRAVVTFVSDRFGLYREAYQTDKSTIYINNVEHDIKGSKPDEGPRSLGGFY